MSHAPLSALIFLTLLNPVLAELPAKDKFHLYLLVGQSNMAGRGEVEAQDKTAHPRVMMLDAANTWQPAIDPIHFDKPNVSGVGPGLMFGKTLADASPDITIGLIPCAVGGTALAAWQPKAKDAATNTTPYDSAIERAKIAMQTGTLKGIIWHQGESDANETGVKKFGDTLEFTLSRFRDQLGIDDLNIVVGQLAPFKTADNPSAQKINQEITFFPHRLAYVACASAEGLNHKGDNLHFDSAGAREFGKRYAAAMIKLHAMPRPAVVKLWPQGLPDGQPLAKAEEKNNARVKLISEPVLMLYPAAKPKGSAVVICPGGGYNILAIEKEGDCVARWLNSMGVSAFVVKNRLRDYKQPAPLMDAQQAIRLVRENAKEWKVDVARVGVMGFSAGGHLAAATSNSDAVVLNDDRYKKYNALDCKPNFTILIYAVSGQPGDSWVKEMYTPIILSEKTPPAFLAHTKDDPVPQRMSVAYHEYLKSKGIATEFFAPETGGHGYGLGQSGGEISQWPERCGKWLEGRGLLEPAQ